MPSARTLFVVALVALAACGGPPAPPPHSAAGAGDSDAVLIVSSGLSDGAQAFAAAEGGITVRVAPSSEASALARAEPIVTQARQRYVAIEFDDALATIRDAVVLLESEAQTRAEFDLLAEALLVRGMAELGLGRDDAARESLLAAARLRPERELDEGRYPPQVRERYEALRAELRAEPASSLTVTTRPGGARLFLDGEPRGTAPDTLYATSGRHQLRVEAPGHATRTLTVVLAPSGEQLEVELPAIDADGAAAQLATADPADLSEERGREALARALGTSLVFRAASVEGGVELTRIDLANGTTRVASGQSFEAAYASLPPPTAGASSSGDDTAPEGAHRHDGLYARLTLGTALRGDEQTLPVPMGDPNKTGGGSLAIDLELAVGGSLAPGVVLGGALLALIGGPELDLAMADGGKPTITVPSALAIFLNWYPSARSGWFVQGLIGGARGERTGGSGEVANTVFVGGIGGLGGGFEWWLASEWSAGVSGRFLLYSLRDQNDGDVVWTALALGVAGTLTYN